jgi:hypothetical protein
MDRDNSLLAVETLKFHMKNCGNKKVIFLSSCSPADNIPKSALNIP